MLSIFKKRQEDQTSLLQQVENYLREKEYHFSHIGEVPTIKLGLRGDNGNWTVYFRSNEINTALTMQLVLPFVVTDNMKLRVADLVNRINCELFFGKFIVDNEDGEISLVIRHLACSKKMDTEEIAILFHTACNTLDEYIPKLAAVAYGNMEPALAIQ